MIDPLKQFAVAVLDSNVAFHRNRPCWWIATPMVGARWSGVVLSMTGSAYTSPEPVAGDGFESWRPGATHLTGAIMAKQHYGSQTFYFH